MLPLLALSIVGFKKKKSVRLWVSSFTCRLSQNDFLVSSISSTSFSKIQFFSEKDIPLGLILEFRSRLLLMICSTFFFEKEANLKSLCTKLVFQNIFMLPFENLTFFTSFSSGFPSMSLL